MNALLESLALFRPPGWLAAVAAALAAAALLTVFVSRRDDPVRAGPDLRRPQRVGRL